MLPVAAFLVIALWCWLLLWPVNVREAGFFAPLVIIGEMYLRLMMGVAASVAILVLYLIHLVVR